MNQTSPAAEKSSPNDQLNRAIEELRGALGDEDPKSAVASSAQASSSSSPGSPTGTGGAGGASGMNAALILNIPVEVQIVLGSAEMPVSELMALQKGSTVSLNRRVGEPVDVVVNGRSIARGEITVLEHDSSRFGIKLTEIITSAKPG
jgi:flagellar motor switch protein FliN